MAASRIQLELLTSSDFVTLLTAATLRHHVGEEAIGLVLGQPLWRESIVEDRQADRELFLRRLVPKRVQRIRSTARATGRCADQGEAVDPIGMGHRQLLSHHPPETDTDY